MQSRVVNLRVSFFCYHNTLSHIHVQSCFKFFVLLTCTFWIVLWLLFSTFHCSFQKGHQKDRTIFFINIKKIKTHKNLLHFTVPSEAGIGTRSSGPHFG